MTDDEKRCIQRMYEDFNVFILVFVARKSFPVDIYHERHLQLWPEYERLHLRTYADNLLSAFKTADSERGIMSAFKRLLESSSAVGDLLAKAAGN